MCPHGYHHNYHLYKVPKEQFNAPLMYGLKLTST